MKAKRDTELDLRLQAEEKIWDMEKTVPRLDSELQEVKIQLKEERDKHQSKGGLTAAHWENGWNVRENRRDFEVLERVSVTYLRLSLDNT
jgi:hypothetical protein